jgi:hypothetical protein
MKPKRKSRGKKSVSGYSVLSPQTAESLLRELPATLSFRFYEDLGKPTEHGARSLVDFCDKLASNQPSLPKESLTFHMQRGDFAAWIKGAVGDVELANKIAKINPNDSRLQKRLRQTVNTRIEHLKETLIAYSIIPEDQCAVPRA